MLELDDDKPAFLALDHDVDTPFQPPQLTALVESPASATARCYWGWGTVLGLCIVAISVIGAVWRFVTLMAQAKNELEQSGQADPATMAGNISQALLTVFWSFVFVLLSLIPLSVCFVKYWKHRKAWKKTNTPEP